VAFALWGCGGGSGGDSTAAGDGGSTATAGPEGESASSGGGSASPSSATPAKGEFVVQANAICKKQKEAGLAAVGEYVKEHGGAAESSAILVRALHVVFLPYVQSQVDEIAALGAPQGDRDEVQAYLNAMQKAVDQAGDSGPNATQVFTQSFAPSAKLARQYGIDACAYGG
jgi:hypothetical protein